MTSLNNRHNEIALRYFNLLSKRFPVMCASDEFHFLPRAENAMNYYDKMDNLSAETVNEVVSELKVFQKELSFLAEREVQLENTIDIELIKANIAGILIEFDRNRSFCHNPLLYLKIACIGLDHAVTKPFGTQQEREDRICSRLDAIPGLLNQAMENLNTIPDTYYTASHAMINDSKQYIHKLGKFWFDAHKENIANRLRKTSTALEAFKKFLTPISPVPDQTFSANSLTDSLNAHFLSQKTPKEIYQIAIDEWHECLNCLEKLKVKIAPSKTWQEIYHTFTPEGSGKEEDTLSLYSTEIENLRLFFSKLGLSQENLYSPIEITETPYYLRSIRGTASFCAAFSTDIREKSYFYITTRLPFQNSTEEGIRLVKRFHREYKYLTAHETIPGHHFLDSIRRSLKNPVRRQIESPLFYEGWASYAETLLTENGYTDDPVEHLIDYKRRLWRSARCQIDIGLSMGYIDKGNAVKLLTTAGFSPNEAERQIYRFQLNPGYQLCYSLGRHEIIELKKSYENQMGSKEFHTFLLEGGELPFYLNKKRFEAKGVT